MSLKKSNIELKKSRIALLGDGVLAQHIAPYLESFLDSPINELEGANFDFKQFSRKLQGISVMDFPEIEKLLEPYNVIINCIAHTDTKDKSKQTHWNLNYAFPAFLADYCSNHNKRLIHISTDYVYAGSKPQANEEDVPVPFNNWYSVTKHLGDEYVQLRCSDFLVIRTAHKPSPFPFKKGYINVLGNFQCLYDANNQIQFLITNGAHGVYNIGSEKPMSIYEYGRSDNERSNIKTKLSPEMYLEDAIPKDTTMSIAKFKHFQKQVYDEKGI